MYSISYEITALVARYILIFLLAIILLRSIFIARAGSHSNLKSMINAAKLKSLDTEKVFYLGYDNIIGCSKRCDIRLEGRGIAKIHVQIYKKKNKWMLCTYTKKTTQLNEIKISGRIEITNNDILKLGAKRYQFQMTLGEKA